MTDGDFPSTLIDAPIAEPAAGEAEPSKALLQAAFVLTLIGSRKKAAVSTPAR